MRELLQILVLIDVFLKILQLGKKVVVVCGLPFNPYDGIQCL